MYFPVLISTSSYWQTFPKESYQLFHLVANSNNSIVVSKQVRRCSPLHPRKLFLDTAIEFYEDLGFKQSHEGMKLHFN
jgi:hypothetical protein